MKLYNECYGSRSFRRVGVVIRIRFRVTELFINRILFCVTQRVTVKTGEKKLNVPRNSSEAREVRGVSAAGDAFS